MSNMDSMDDLKEINNIDEKDKKLITYAGEDKVIPAPALYQVLSQIQRKEIKFWSAIPMLDKMVDGFQNGELTVISGQTKSGKTLWCQTLTYEFARQGINSLWFTYEVPALQFLRQFGKELPLFFMPKKLSSNVLRWIEQRIIEGILKYNIQVVFIDHLHFLIDMEKSNISLEIGKVMRYIKRLAIKYDLCIFIVAHTGKTKFDKEPDYEDIRDSSFISQESDNTFMIWRSHKEESVATLKVCLNRRKGILNKKIKLIKVGTFLRELSKEEEAK